MEGIVYNTILLTIVIIIIKVIKINANCVMILVIKLKQQNSVQNQNQLKIVKFLKMSQIVLNVLIIIIYRIINVYKFQRMKIVCPKNKIIVRNVKTRIISIRIINARNYTIF